jgi:hypothetical protein
MSVREKIANSNFMIRLSHWEYWPFGIVQFPAILYWLWLSLKARSPLFFTASNPGIPMGGMFGESKYDILKKISPRYVPRTERVTLPATRNDVLRVIRENNFRLPVIFKPDLGERGFMVERIADESQIDNYLAKIKVDFLIQDLVDLPAEFGVFYRRFPDQDKGEVVSIVMKEMLSVVGDGSSTLQQLIVEKKRAKLQWHSLKHRYHAQLNDIIPEGRKIELVSIGNHARGTKFMNGNHLINGQLSETFDHISKQIEGFYYGRFDLRCSSEADLYTGNVQILELNGCGAEQAHIYEPGFSLWEAMRINISQWSNIYRIASINKSRGHRIPTMKEALAYYKKFKEATRP